MRIGFVLTHRLTILSMNAVLAVIALVTLWDTFILLRDMAGNVDAIENLLDGIATIFVAYGVALEERDTLMKVFKLYPHLESARQTATDKLCHFYGLSYLLIGLFMEVMIEVVKLPYRVLNNPAAEGAIFAIGLLFCLAAVVLLVRNSFSLFRKERTSLAPE